MIDVEPFDQVQVRQAIAMGIDRQRIVDNFYPAGSEVASHFTPCSIPNGCTGEAWYEFNVEEAKRLLTEAGFPDGFSTVLNYRDVVLDDKSASAFLQRRGMRLDLGGIAKLPILQAGMNVLKRHGIDNAMVNGGGDVLVSGALQGRPWRVGVRDARAPS